MKNCPYCDEEIQEEAKKCRFCSEWLVKKDITIGNKEESPKEELINTEVNKVEKKNNFHKILGYVIVGIFIIALGSHDGHVSLNNQALEHYYKGEYSTALTKINSAINKKEDPLYFSNRCLIYKNLRELDKGLNDCITAYGAISTIDEISTIEMIYLNYSTLLMSKGEYEKGKQIIDEGISNGIDNGLLYNNLGYYYISNKDYNTAVDYLLKALDKGLEGENYSTAYGNLGLSYIELDDYESAKISLDKGLEYNSEDPVLLAHYGYYYLALSDYNTSTEYYLKAYKIDKNTELVISNLAFLSLVNGDFVSLYTYLNEAEDIGDMDKQTKAIRSLAMYWKNEASSNMRKDYIEKLKLETNIDFTDFDLYNVIILFQSLEGVMTSNNENLIFENIIKVTDKLIEKKDFILYSYRLNLYAKVMAGDIYSNELPIILDEIYNIYPEYDYETDFLEIEESINKAVELSDSL